MQIYAQVVSQDTVNAKIRVATCAYIAASNGALQRRRARCSDAGVLSSTRKTQCISAGDLRAAFLSESEFKSEPEPDPETSQSLCGGLFDLDFRLDLRANDRLGEGRWEYFKRQVTVSLISVVALITIYILHTLRNNRIAPPTQHKPFSFKMQQQARTRISVA
jgi:hypothetical protein